MTNAFIIYTGILALAALEAFTPTAYLVPGTIGVVAAGGFVQACAFGSGAEARKFPESGEISGAGAPKPRPGRRDLGQARYTLHGSD